MHASKQQLTLLNLTHFEPIFDTEDLPFNACFWKYLSKTRVYEGFRP